MKENYKNIFTVTPIRFSLSITFPSSFKRSNKLKPIKNAIYHSKFSVCLFHTNKQECY